MNKIRYIHHGSKLFDINNFKEIKNVNCFNKPYGGFWASRKNDANGWLNWCKENEYITKDYNKKFEFELKDSANTLLINSVEVLESLPKLDNFSFQIYFLDFEKLSKKYDAIELIINPDPVLYYKLYGWDCNSILIMNANIIKE